MSRAFVGRVGRLLVSLTERVVRRGCRGFRVASMCKWCVDFGAFVGRCEFFGRIVLFFLDEVHFGVWAMPQKRAWKMFFRT